MISKVGYVMKRISLVLFLTFFLSPVICKDYNINSNYLSLEGDTLEFKTAVLDGENHILKLENDSVVPVKVINSIGFTHLSDFYIPNGVDLTKSEWNIRSGVTVRLNKITTLDSGAVFLHFLVIDDSFNKSVLQYVYSKDKGVVLFNILTGGAKENFYRTFVLAGDVGLGQEITMK